MSFDESEESNPFDIRFLDPKSLRLFRTDPADSRVRLTIADDRSWREVRISLGFPFSDPSHYIGFRDGDDRDIGLLIELRDIDEVSRAIIDEEIARRYFTPKVTRVIAVSEAYGVVNWDVETDRGPRKYVVRNLRDNSYPLGPDRIMMTDTDGNRYEFPKVSSLGSKAGNVLMKVM